MREREYVFAIMAVVANDSVFPNGRFIHSNYTTIDRLNAENTILFLSN